MAICNIQNKIESIIGCGCIEVAVECSTEHTTIQGPYGNFPNPALHPIDRYITEGCCLRSRHVTPNVVCQSVSQYSNIESDDRNDPDNTNNPNNLND